MPQYLRKVVFSIIIFAALLPCCAGAAPDSARLPDSLVQQLQALQRADDLANWIYARIDYMDRHPQDNLDFLMSTQRAAWRSYYTYPEREAWFNLLILQGYYQLQAGNILASVNAYESAVQFFESYPLPLANTDEYIDYVLKPLGNNYTRLADYNTALFIQQKALAIVQQRQDRQETAAIYSNMATSARWKGDLSAATAYCKLGIAIVDRNTLLYGLLLSTYADVLAEQQRYDTAGILCRQALDRLHRLPPAGPTDDLRVLWYASALQLASRLALQEGRHERAAGYGATALQLLEKYYPSSRQREKAKIQVLLGDVLLRTGRYQSSLEAYQQALRLLLPGWKPELLATIPADKWLYSENTIADALAGKAAALARMQQQEAALQHYFAVFRAARLLRKEFYSTDSKIRDLQVLRSRANAAMTVAWELWSATNDKKYREQLLLIAELSKAQVLMDERAARFQPGSGQPAQDTLLRKMKRLKEAVVYYQHESIAGNAPGKWRSLQQEAEYELSLLDKKLRQTGEGRWQEQMMDTGQLAGCYASLPPGTRALEFFEGAPYSYLVEADRSGVLAVYRTAGGDSLQASIRNFLQQWFARGASAMMNGPQSFYRDCYTLYKKVFADFAWQPALRYIIIPDGVFNYLPFDALITEPGFRSDTRQWPFLFRKAVLSQAYSLQTWHSQQAQQYLPGRFAAFFVSKGRDSRQPALSVEKEYALLSGQLQQGQYYFNEKATWQAFRNLSDSITVLHIGTHAVSSARDSFPYLQLYDQPFLLSDLRYKHFAPSLVVLGACRTADGLLMEGEGINSLSRGFTAAGAGGVVSGLWNVNDEAATEIMGLFYKALQEGMDPAMALHRSREQWLQAHTEDAALQLPYYWAGLLYSGHLQPVSMAGPGKNYGVYGIGALLLLAGAAGFISILRKRRSVYSSGHYPS